MDPDAFKELPIIGILRGIELTEVDPLTQTIIQSGLKTIEVTMNTPQAPALIREFIKQAGNKLTIGAGTVVCMEDLRQALAAGATFIVSPVLIPEVISTCKRQGIAVFPGALTPQEIYHAWQAGATMVKVFPAGVFGPKYFKDIKGPLADVELLACGGVTAENIKDYFANGAGAVAFGSSIFKNDWLKSKQYPKIGEQIKEMIRALKK